MPLHPHSDNARGRVGSTYLEVQAALILFVLGVSGLVPLAVVNSRQAKMLSARVPADTVQYLTPPANPWAAKLGSAAGISETAAPPKSIAPDLVDNDDPGFSLELPLLWTYDSAADAYDTTFRRNTLLLLSGKSIWTFLELDPGHYEVYVTYPASILHATLTPFTVYDDNSLVGSVTVDQTTAPTGASYGGVPWHSLGQYSISSGTLRVKMDSFTTILVAADAVRIVPLTNDVELLSVQASPGADEITVEARVQ
jgi:hypothetical protein